VFLVKTPPYCKVSDVVDFEEDDVDVLVLVAVLRNFAIGA
jgi:hypothetical protein